VEELPVKVTCEENFLRTTTRADSGRYIISLPFCDPKNVKSALGHSRSSALSQFLRTEQRRKRDSQLKTKYDSVFQEYLESTTTKLRVIFYASSPSENGASFNDIIHAGPVLKSDLTIQILKWKDFRYVYSSDIEKMFRQIWVDPKHTRFQRILFRNSEKHIQDFELQNQLRPIPGDSWQTTCSSAIQEQATSFAITCM